MKVDFDGKRIHATNKPKRCELCLNVDFTGDNYKHVICMVTGDIVQDVNKLNNNCPIT